MPCCGGDSGDRSPNACDLKGKCAFAKCDSCPEQMVKCRASGCGGRVHPLCWKKLHTAQYSGQPGLTKETPLCSTKCAATFKPEGPK